ncbi:MAG: hypothetical protein K9M57_03750 [Phycisphaerae bacterium]|nr:hypothetical protein [Phycisphaerae bacterium]
MRLRRAGAVMSRVRSCRIILNRPQQKILIVLVLLAVLLHLRPFGAQADEKKETGPVVTGEQAGDLPHFAEFKSRYVDGLGKEPTVEDPKCEPVLPAVLKAMLVHRHTRLLDRYLAVTQGVLFDRCLLNDLQICFYANVTPNPSAEILAEELVEGGDYLTITHGVLGDLMAWLDWYPDNDWESRFGKTGFFGHLSEIQQNLVLSDAAYWYFRSRSFRCSNRDTTAGAPASKTAVVTALRGNLEKLTAILGNTSIQQSNSQQLRLWQSRLYRELVSNSPDYLVSPAASTIRASIKKISPDDFDTYLESLRLQFVEGGHRVSKTREVLTKITQLRLWLNKNSKTIKGVTGNRLQLALFESMVQQDIIKHSTASPERQFLFDRCYLDSLKDLAGGFPELEPEISDLVARHLAVSLVTVSGMGGTFSLDKFLDTCDDFEIQALGGHYQNRRSPDFLKAIYIYQSFLRNRKPDHPVYPLVLYHLGLCNFQLVAPETQAGHTKKAHQYTLEAIKFWHQLARDHPGFSTIYHQDTVSAQKAISMAVSLSWGLYREDPAAYGPRTRDVLGTLVGQVAPGQVSPTGPFSKSETARAYRYFYGQLFQDAKLYQQAAAILATVGREDENYLQAVYQQAYCCYHDLASQEISPDQLALRYRVLITRFTRLINDNLDNAIAINTMLLLDQLCHKTGDISLMIDPLSRVLEVGGEPSELLGLAMRLLNEQWAELLASHGRGDRVELPGRLADSLHLARLVYASFEGKPADNQSSQAFKLLLEYLAVSSVNVSNGASVRDLVSLMSRVDILLARGRRIPGFSKQIWFVRCEALLRFSQGEYGTSRKLWHTIRTSTKPTADTRLGYYWWESRYYSLRCASAMGSSDQTGHVIDVMLKSYPDAKSPWRARLKAWRLSGKPAD